MKTSELYVSKENRVFIQRKLRLAITVFKEMGVSGKMEGSQFIPYELNDIQASTLSKKIKYDPDIKHFQIDVLRPKNKGYPRYINNPNTMRILKIEEKAI